MARSTFGGTGNDYLFDNSGRFVKLVTNRTFTCWDSATGGTKYTDLLNAAGSAVTAITTDSNGFYSFQGPDGVLSVWADTGTGTRSKIVTNDGPTNAAIDARITVALPGAVSNKADKRTTTDNTYYVSKAGSDSNDGRSEGSAFLTVAKAVSKQPSVTIPDPHTLTRIMVGPGDFHEPAIVINKAANLEIVGTGARSGAAVGGRGGTTIYTPIGSVGITIGYRDDTNSSWLGVKAGTILRNLQIRPDGTDTGSSTGVKLIGYSNCSFYDVAVCDYQGTGSIGWHAQSHVIANGGSAGATMYNNWYSCTASRCKVGWKAEGADLALDGCLIDGQDDISSTYLTGATGVLCTSGGNLYASMLKIQAVETGIDQSQTHSAGTVFPLVVHGLRMEALKTGVISNQLETIIKGGTFYSGGLAAGTTGTIAFDMRAAAEFTIEDVWIGGVETQVAVTSGASGVRRDAQTGVTYWGTKLRGIAGGIYKGTAATSTGSTGGVPTVTLTGSAGTSPSLGGTAGSGLDTGSTDMQGRVVYTTGTSPGAGVQATVTFATAFASGVKPIVVINRETTGSNIYVNATSISNTAFSININAAPAASTANVYGYAIVGFTT